MTATTVSSHISVVENVPYIVVQIIIIDIRHVGASFGGIVREPNVEVLLVNLGVLAQDLCLGSLGGCFDFLGMLIFEAHGRRVYRAFRIGKVEVSIVTGHVDAAQIALQILALRAGHLVAAIAFDKWLLASVAVADQSLASGFLDLVTMAENRLFVALPLVFLAGIWNVCLVLTFATAGDVASRRLTVKFKVNVDG
jgi:hypothetical protein